MIFPHCLVLTLLHFLVISTFLFPSGAEPRSGYLKLPLVHRDPALSPRKALDWDLQRLAALRAPVVSGASTGSGQYLVDLRLGTPPQRLQLVVDTGSDLVWVRCSACRNCSRRPAGTAFRARHSTTFAPFHCYSPDCRRAPAPPPADAPPCNRTVLHSPCRYQHTYADGSSTSGFFSHDTVTLNACSSEDVKVRRRLDFGCGFGVSGPSLSGARGVLGLGRGPISFASQVGKAFGNKFSYCLMDYTLSPPPTSYLLIGDGEQLRGSERLHFTPLLANPLSPTFYYVGIEAASVDGVRLQIDPSVWALDGAGNGGTIVDSGTTLTFLPEPAYRRILSAFRRRVRLPRVSPPDPNLEFCVNVSSSSSPAAARRGRTMARLPRLSFRLSGGAVFSPPPRNYFVDAAPGVQCLALLPVSPDSGFSVIGNLMQQGFLFVFNREESRVGFSRTGCATS